MKLLHRALLALSLLSVPALASAQTLYQGGSGPVSNLSVTRRYDAATVSQETPVVVAVNKDGSVVGSASVGTTSATAPTSATENGCVFNTTPPTVASGQLAQVQCSNRGVLGVQQAALPTYVASIAAAPTGSGAVLLIQGSASKTIRITRIGFSGTHTAAERGGVSLTRYTTAATGGTTGAAPVVQASDSANAASSAVLTSYTAAPTPGTSAGFVRLAKLLVSTATTTGDYLQWTFGGAEAQYPTLRGTSQWLGITTTGFASYAGASDFIEVEWTEE